MLELYGYLVTSSYGNIMQPQAYHQCCRVSASVLVCLGKESVLQTCLACWGFSEQISEISASVNHLCWEITFISYKHHSSLTLRLPALCGGQYLQMICYYWLEIHRGSPYLTSCMVSSVPYCVWPGVSRGSGYRLTIYYQLFLLRIVYSGITVTHKGVVD